MSIKSTIKKTVYIFLISVITTTPTYAAPKFDEQFYSSNDILYYDPTATCTSGAGGVVALSGSDNEQKAWNYFTGKGLTPQQAAGIIGNFQVEAPGLDPKINQSGGGPGRGLAQWSVDGRWAQLQRWANGKDIYALETQLGFVWYELNGSEKAALDALKNTSTIKDATETFMLKYERPGVPHLDRRVALANDAFGRYSGSSAPDTQNSTGSSEETTACSSSAGSGDIVAVAQAELAKNVKEDPIGCDNGNRSVKGKCGPEVDKYTDSTLEWWCADFVSWVYKEAGHPFTGGSSGGWRTPAVSSVKSWFEKNGIYTNNGPSANPSPGDVYILQNGGGLYHIGIVEKVEGNTMYGISGNTTTSNVNNGDGVGRATYTNFKSDSSINGFGGLRK